MAEHGADRTRADARFGMWAGLMTAEGAEPDTEGAEGPGIGPGVGVDCEEAESKAILKLSPEEIGTSPTQTVDTWLLF